MKIIVGIPLLALVVFLNSIGEGSCRDAGQPEPLFPTTPDHPDHPDHPLHQLHPPPPVHPPPAVHPVHPVHPAPPQKDPEHTVAIVVHHTDYLMAPMMSGHWYGGGYHEQVKGIPDFIHHPKAPGNMCQVYVEMPNGSGLVGNLLPLKAAPVKGIKIVHAAVKVEDGFALVPLMPIDPTKIPNQVVHTRLYVVTPEGIVIHGIITKKDIHHLPHIGHSDAKS